MNLIVSMKLDFKILKRNSKRPKLPKHSKNIEHKTKKNIYISKKKF